MKHCKLGGNGIVVAADVSDMLDLQQLLQAISGIHGITGVKIGFLLAMQGLERVVDMVHAEFGDGIDIIYDHQKAGNDIPDMGSSFAKQLKRSGVDAAILFPFTGPETQSVWTEACFGEGLDVLTGGIMTHPKFLVSEGGYIAEESVLKIYRLAADLGCKHFIVPGTKIDWVIAIREFLESLIGFNEFSLHAPGLVTQGGDISECGKVAGASFFPIIGRAIYAKQGLDAQRNAAKEITERFLSQLTMQGGFSYEN